MKGIIMKKKLSILLLGIAILGLTSGCFKRDDMEDIQIYTTVYPITYIINELYGDYATIDSIYPNGVDINNYELTDKQINDYSKGDLFIYNGQSNEKEIARKLLNKNQNMKIIDVSYGLTAEYSTDTSEELWLSPNNFLMLATTTKDNLCDFITSTYIKEEINKNYEKMQEEVSLIDAELRSVGSSSAQKNKNTIIVSSNTFKFLENYGFNVISLENEKNYTNDLKNNFKNKTYQYVFIKDDDETDAVKELKNSYGATEVSINSLDVLTDDEVKNNENYINMMKSFIKSLSDVVL
jgi:zinc transport system substrate-binding protein